MASLLHRHGVPAHELSFFRERRAVGQRWLGLDYYATCEHRVASTGRRTPARSRRGLRSLAREYHDRYRIPLFHCETNRTPPDAEAWLVEQFEDVLSLRREGIPVFGFTWYSLTDQMDWHIALRERRNEVHPVGLLDLDRRERPVGAAYRALVQRWSAPLARGDDLDLTRDAAESA